MTDNIKKIWCTFNYLEIELPERCLQECYHQGACDNDVEYWFNRLKININPEKLRKELKDYGAWDNIELSDHDQNVRRIIWIAAGNYHDRQYSEID